MLGSLRSFARLIIALTFFMKIWDESKYEGLRQKKKAAHIGEDKFGVWCVRLFCVLTCRPKRKAVFGSQRKADLGERHLNAQRLAAEIHHRLHQAPHKAFARHPPEAQPPAPRLHQRVPVGRCLCRALSVDACTGPRLLSVDACRPLAPPPRPPSLSTQQGAAAAFIQFPPLVQNTAAPAPPPTRGGAPPTPRAGLYR